MTSKQNYHQVAFRPETFEKFERVKELKFGTGEVANTTAIDTILTEIINEHTENN